MGQKKNVEEIEAELVALEKTRVEEMFKEISSIEQKYGYRIVPVVTIHGTGSIIPSLDVQKIQRQQ